MDLTSSLWVSQVTSSVRGWCGLTVNSASHDQQPQRRDQLRCVPQSCAFVRSLHKVRSSRRQARHSVRHRAQRGQIHCMGQWFQGRNPSHHMMYGGSASGFMNQRVLFHGCVNQSSHHCGLACQQHDASAGATLGTRVGSIPSSLGTAHFQEWRVPSRTSRSSNSVHHGLFQRSASILGPGSVQIQWMSTRRHDQSCRVRQDSGKHQAGQDLAQVTQEGHITGKLELVTVKYLKLSSQLI